MLLEIEPIVHPLVRFIADLPASEFVRSSVWAYPALETLHLFGLGLVFGPILIFDLRILGAIRTGRLPDLAALLLPWVFAGLALNLVSGVLLFGSDAIEFSGNIAFQAKLALIALAVLNALAFQSRAAAAMRRLADAPASAGELPASLRLHAALSILFWCSVIVAGRMIAYVA